MHTRARIPAESPSTRVPWMLIGLVGGATLLTSINFSLVFMAFGDISKTFASSPDTVQWALTGFSITAAALWIPAGWMSDRFGRERVFFVGLVLFTLGSAVVAWSPSVMLLIFGRVIQASGLALESSAAMPILIDAFDVSRRSTVVGAIGATGGVAAAIGPVIGGALVEAIGWRWTFALNIPVGLVLSLAVWKRMAMPSSDDSSAPPDVIGIAALAAGMGSLVLAISKVNAWGIGAPSTLAAFALAVVLLALVVRRSVTHPDPVLYLALFREASFRRGAILNFFIAGTFSGTFFAFIRLLTEGWKMSVYEAGVAVAVIPLLGGPLSLLAGRIADQRGARSVIVPGAILISIAGIWFATAVSAEKNIVGLWLPVAIVYGIGVGLAHAACQAAALREVVPERLGVAGGMSRLAMEIGGIITVATAVALVSSAANAVDGVRTFCIMVSVVCFGGALYATRIARR